jgi:predicted metal-dependent enzyme (double-stranded beta helix superfamily)
LFYWPVGAATPIHDHSAWGVYQCVGGALLEDRYERLDDGQQPETAHLRKRWRRRWGHWEGASTVGAYAEGIHRIANHSRRPSLSLHMYGPRTGTFDGRDYDPSRDFVCDRFEPLPDAIAGVWYAMSGM